MKIPCSDDFTSQFHKIHEGRNSNNLFKNFQKIKKGKCHSFFLRLISPSYLTLTSYHKKGKLQVNIYYHTNTKLFLTKFSERLQDQLELIPKNVMLA